MIIYNITTNVDESIHEDWVNWMQEIHVPKVLATGKFTKVLMCEVLVKEDLGGVTYSIQYTCDSSEMLLKYHQEDAQRLKDAVIKKFGNKFGDFRTEMKIVKEFIN